MVPENEEILVWKFSEKVVDFVLADREFDTWREIFCAGNASYPFDPNVGKVVIGLIKGALKFNLQKTTGNYLLQPDKHNRMELVLRNFPETFFEIYPFNNFNVLKAISYIIMHSLFYYNPDETYPLHLAYRGIARLLLTADGGKFVQNDGFTNLINYSTELIETDEILKFAYNRGTYPW